MTNELIEAEFTYDLVDKDQAAKLRYCAREIQKLKEQIAIDIMSFGEHLSIAHEQFAKQGTGTFLKWVDAECGISKSTAYNYMAAFRVFGAVVPTVGNLEDCAIYALAQNKTPEKARKEVLKLADKGVRITLKTAKEIIQRHKNESIEDAPAGESPFPATPKKPGKRSKVKAEITPEEQIKLNRQLARDYITKAVNAVDDYHEVKPNSRRRADVVKLLQQAAGNLW